jgi:predicted O-methyltransferase YrrM
MKNPFCVEIGRLFGGSTILMAGAGGYVLSLDLHIAKSIKNKGKYYDSLLQSQLKEMGLIDKVEIKVANSSKYQYKRQIDLVFIDGDHSYQGVKRDYEQVFPFVKNGGHILFHDACKTRDEATIKKEVYEFVRTLKLKKIKEIGSLVHFIKEEE